MSCQDATYDIDQIGKIVSNFLKESLDSDKKVEILIYQNDDGKWIVTCDKPFFSLGYKIEDRVKNEIKIKSTADKDNVVLALVNSGYKVRAKQVGKNFLSNDSYWLIGFE